MYNYDTIKTDQYVIEIANLIRSVFHLQSNDKKYVMDTIEINNQVYLFHHTPYQYNMEYLETFKAQIKVSKAHYGAIVYHKVLATAVLPDKNTTSR